MYDFSLACQIKSVFVLFTCFSKDQIPQHLPHVVILFLFVDSYAVTPNTRTGTDRGCIVRLPVAG